MPSDVNQTEDMDLRMAGSSLADGLPASLHAKYEILGELGAGGMAIVYKARHRLTGQMVAIKILKQQDATTSKRFAQEAKTVTGLAHPNIVAVHDFDIAGDTAYLVMELVEGRSLADVLREQSTLRIDQFLRLMDQVCEGLNYAHEMGVMHRDIKPSNILLKSTDSGEVAKIADFGLAKSTDDVSQNLTQTGQILGTPLYMSPEQCMGQAPTKLSDIYSLGCMMYEALTGAVPLAGTNLMETAHFRATQVPKSFGELKVAGVPRHIEAAVLQCLQREVSDRTASVSIVANQLRGKAGRGRIPRRTSSPKSVGKILLAIGLTAVILLCGLGGLIFATCERFGIPLKSILDPSRGLQSQAEIMMRAGDLSMRQKNYGGAMRCYEMLEAIARKENSLKWQAKAVAQQAQVASEQNKVDEAVEKMNRSVALAEQAYKGQDAVSAHWHTKAARFYISCGRYEEAQSEVKKAVGFVSRTHGQSRERELGDLVETYNLLCQRTGTVANVDALMRIINARSSSAR